MRVTQQQQIIDDKTDSNRLKSLVREVTLCIWIYILA